MSSTYQLQAEFMAEQYGRAQALKDARRFEQANAKIRDREGARFWHYVIWFLEQQREA